jgi:phosphoglycolate phosphatase
VLFDVDATLVLTGRAGIRALTHACKRVLGRPQALAGIPVAGRTDWRILADATARIGQPLDGALLDDLRAAYLECLREQIQQPGDGVKGVLPGVRALLDSLSAHPGALLGLLTGNFEEGARIKLEYFDLWRYFRCGAYGDDAADRNALVPFALDRARACTGRTFAANDTVVIGDTPHDVACARTVGARPIGVATGGFSADDLRQSGAELVFADLSDTRAVLTGILNLES